MKILLISMPSVHVIRWIENLQDSNYELYWFDILERGEIQTLDSVHQFTNWKKRKKRYIKGEFFLSKKMPFVYRNIIPFLEVTLDEALQKVILEIQPDIIHSFEMQSCSYPILKTIEKFPNIKWIYSCWGSDLYHYRNFKNHISQIKAVLKRVNFLLTDCERDHIIAKELGFKNQFLGIIPGGAGFKIDELEPLRLPINERKLILVKGYEHNFGRGLNVVKALESLQAITSGYEVVVFGAHPSVKKYIHENKLDFKVYDRHELTHQNILELMGKSLLYIGNSISDGMPNTLLEAIVMGAFPIQSNPGGVTAEIINHKVNGLLIENPEDVNELKILIAYFFANKNISVQAQKLNYSLAQDKFEYETNKKAVIEMYQKAANI
ncbi:glycosyltransferase [Flavobacterium sp.]|uniref:glycosyltransferase n=1 Tax=Flavobacterium sp. TaxID=239 RepID=UPI00374D4937